MDVRTLTEVCLQKKKERDAALSVCTTDEQRQACYTETLDRYRCDLEPYIWQHLMTTYGPALDRHWETHQFPKKSPHAWVIVERRCHPNWWFLLRNIAWAGPTFSLYIFCSDENEAFVRALLGDKIQTVHLHPIFKGTATRQKGKDQYAALFKCPEFYQTIDAEYMIRAEPDTYLRHKVPDAVFTGDFYGAPWAWAMDKPGGGGLHVRRIAAMIQLCTRANHRGTEGEDSWLGDKVQEYGLAVPSLAWRTQIFSENFPVEDPIGVHQFWTFLDNFQIAEPARFQEHLARYLRIDV